MTVHVRFEEYKTKCLRILEYLQSRSYQGGMSYPAGILEFAARIWIFGIDISEYCVYKPFPRVNA